MIILLYILLGWFILAWIMKLLAPWLMRMAVRRAQKRMEQQVRDMFGGAATRAAGGRAAYNQGPQPEPTSKKKIIDDEVGEYVRFEEVEVTETTTTEKDIKTGTERTKVDYRVEDQVVDVEWEDL